MWSEVMLQTIHVATPVSQDEYGQVTWSEPTPIACRYEPGRRLLRTARGTQEAVEATIYTHGAVSIDDLVWPPGADTTKATQGRIVLAVEQHYDLMGGQAEFKTVMI